MIHSDSTKVIKVFEFFVLSEDGNTLLPTRGTSSVGTRNAGAQLDSTQKTKSSEEKIIDGVLDGVKSVIQGVGIGTSEDNTPEVEQ